MGRSRPMPGSLARQGLCCIRLRWPLAYRQNVPAIDAVPLVAGWYAREGPHDGFVWVKEGSYRVAGWSYAPLVGQLPQAVWLYVEVPSPLIERGWADRLRREA